MEKIESIFDKAVKAGRKIELKKSAKELEMSVAEEAVKAAAEEMEKAAIEGNESAYAQAKDKKNAAENRLEILQIRAKNRVDIVDLTSECAPVLKELEKDSINEMRKMIRGFLSKYDELCGMIDAIDRYSQQYNKIQAYFRDHVIRSDKYKIKYMAEILPVVLVNDFKKKFTYHRFEIEKFLKYDR